MASKATKTAAKKATGSARADAATKLLMADHKEVHAMFQQYKKLADADADGVGARGARHRDLPCAHRACDDRGGALLSGGA